jgi:hypothetical protein
MRIVESNGLSARTLWLLVLLVATACFVACDGSPNYRGFMGQNQTYYCEIADGCDQLIIQNNKGLLKNDGPSDLKPPQLYPDVAHTVSLSGTNKALSSLLQELHATAFWVSSNRVYVRIGPMTRYGWGIIWEQDESDTNLWRLSTNGDGLQKEVYSVRKFIQLSTTNGTSTKPSP